MSIKVHESDMQTVHLALPPDPNITEEQLRSDLGRPLLLLVEALAGRIRVRMV